MYTAIYIIDGASLDVVVRDFPEKIPAFAYMNVKYEEGIHIQLYDEFGDFVRVSTWLNEDVQDVQQSKECS